MHKNLTPLQEQVLGYVDSEGPVSVVDVAGSLLISGSSARSRLDTLARRGLVDATYTGHDRGRGRAYVTTNKGSELAAQVFGSDEDEGDDTPLPVRIVVHHGSISRFVDGTVTRGQRGLTSEDLTDAERAAVETARGNEGTATVGHITVVPGRNMGVVEEWWK